MSTSSPHAHVLGTSWKALSRFWPGHHDAKESRLPKPDTLTEQAEDSEDESEESIDAAQAAELLYSAQDDIINHDYGEALKKLEKGARYGNSAACAYLANILSHGLDCSDDDHEEDKVDADPPTAARWAVRGLEIELGKQLDPPLRAQSEEAPFASDIKTPSEGLSTPSATPSESGPFDLQCAADCASTLTLLFRTRKVRVKSTESGKKGKSVDIADLAQRIGRLMLEHEAVRTPIRNSHSSEKSRRIVNINLHYLMALLEVEREQTPEAESDWKKVVAHGAEGPVGDQAADELVGNARRRLILLQNARRGSEDQVPRLPPKEPPPSPRPKFERHSSQPMRRTSTNESRRATFDMGPDEPVSPMSDRTEFLAPPSPRSARSMRRKQSAKTAPAPPAASQPFFSFRALSAIFRTGPPTAPASVAVEAGSAIVPPQEKLRSRVSLVSMVHDTLPPSKSMLFRTMRKDMSAASLPDLVSPVRLADSTSSGLTARMRTWTEFGMGVSPPSDAADSLREALRRHETVVAEMSAEEDEAEGEEQGSPKRQTSLPLPPPAVPAPKSSQHGYIKGLDPALAKLEDASRVNVMSVCAVCDAKGVNFPRCPKCRQTYCSRACRISGGGDGERHVCLSPDATATPSPTNEPAS